MCIDIIYKYIKNKKIVSFLSGFFDNFVQTSITIILFFTIGVFGSGSVPDFLTKPIAYISLTVVVSCLGGLAGYGAYLVYSRIKDTNVVRRIQK